MPEKAHLGWRPPARLNKRFSRITVLAVLLIVVASLTLWRDRLGVLATLLSLLHRDPSPPEYYPFSTTSHFSPVSVDNPMIKTPDELCAAFPRHLLNSVQPVLKMGHGENRQKIEAQLDSVSACFGDDDLLIFSDLEETVRGRRVIDILADLPAGYYDIPDFQNYLWQKEMKENGTLDEDPVATKKIDGWILDKYKFLPMIERAWVTKPNKEFYFFLETDTYVFWDNVFRFLRTFDPDKPIYMGSPSPGRSLEGTDTKTWFANGGPGFVLSRGAVKALIERKVDFSGQYTQPPLAEKWLPELRGECCGDSALGWALWNISIPLQGYWPMFNPHPLHGIPYGHKSWCQPVLTLHKTWPEDMRKLWKWEFGQRRLGRPLLYADLWYFHHPGQPAIMDHWDNGAFDGWDATPEDRIESSEACKNYCQRFEECVQWHWRSAEKKCIAMRSFRYGEKAPSADDAELGLAAVNSGWMSDRIKRFREKNQCEEVQWVGPSITRIF